MSPDEQNDHKETLPKAYDPSTIEQHWAEYWVSERLFDVATPNASTQEATKKFVHLLPPPNVTGRLHIGHMLNQTEMDILTRWHRMLGDLALWVPGTDHAGIATQMMVERQLKAEGITRQQLGREAFEARVWQWKSLYGNAILDQMKRLGSTVDWSREYFTMDDRLSVAVKEAFVRLYEQGLIYRGAYIVNWCPGCQTAISDLEVIHEERVGKLYEIRYPFADGSGSIVIATTRPETMLGDVAVAVNPADERYTGVVGKLLRLPQIGRAIPIIADDWAKPEFGTGAVKVTPAHDPNDFAIGQRHSLANLNIMDTTAHIDLPGSPYHGLDRYEARTQIVIDLEAQGLLVRVKDHNNSIGLCDRSKDVIEPRLSKQWFVSVNKAPASGGDSIAANAIAAVEKGFIKFTPDQYRKTYDEWMKNIYDWCISRQLWWGHRIPAWHCAACGQITVARETPVECEHCHRTEISQETDVLDTWFSSGLLPFTVFGWPSQNELAAAREVISTGAEAEATYERHIGDARNYAHVKLWIEPKVPGTGFEFSSNLAQGTLPDKYVEAARLGIATAMKAGIVAGNEMVDVKVCLIEAQYHEADSSESAFQIAGSQAFQEAARKAKTAVYSGNGSASTLTHDLAAFYPTQLLVTGFDILFFWVARMIMLGSHFMLDVPMPDGSKRTLADAVPFREVYIHALVRDADRQKMSKTKGNVVDPIEVITKFGTDAVRFTLASMASPGTDIAFSEARTEGNRAFANKIWNAARFLFMNIERAKEAGAKIDPSRLGAPHLCTGLLEEQQLPLETRWIISRLSDTAAAVNKSLAEYRFDEAASSIYQFFWGDLCDWYLEIVKLRLNFVAGGDNAEALASLQAFTHVFESALRLLSPFMPFITEEIWHALYNQEPPAKSIALTRYPQTEDFHDDEASVRDMEMLQQIIVAVRGIRKEIGVPEKEATAIRVHSATGAGTLAHANADMLAKLARVSAVELTSAPLSGDRTRSSAAFDVEVVYQRTIDIPAERERLTKDLAKYEKGLDAADRQLGNEAFMGKAPANIVEGLRRQHAETKMLYNKTQAALDALPPG